MAGKRLDRRPVWTLRRAVNEYPPDEANREGERVNPLRARAQSIALGLAFVLIVLVALAVFADWPDLF